MTVGSVSGWEAFSADRIARRDAAVDDATRQHFEKELELAQITMKAMGLDVPNPSHAEKRESGHSGPTAEAAPTQFYADTSSDVPTETEFSDYDAYPETSPSGSDTLSANLGGALEPYRDDILAASEATGVPANLLTAVIWDESKGVPSVGTINGENGLTDTGLMQLNPRTFEALKNQYPDLLTGHASDPQTNIMAGALYLKEQHNEFGDWDLALRAYNSGPLSVDPSDHTISTTGLGTMNYVEKVTFYQELLDQGQPLPDGYPGGNKYY